MEKSITPAKPVGWRTPGSFKVETRVVKTDRTRRLERDGLCINCGETQAMEGRKVCDTCQRIADRRARIGYTCGYRV